MAKIKRAFQHDEKFGWSSLREHGSVKGGE
jgi:hypothetical protein